MTSLLDLFWDKGVTKVSPGALGMMAYGRPMPDEKAQFIAERTPGAYWDGTWIVLTKRPGGDK